MSETRKSGIFVIAAVVLTLLAVFTSPRQVTPDEFFDQGEQFFPDFTDPNAARTLEVIEYDEATGTPRPFKVTYHDGLWTIPSHYGYPADGKDRLAKTAAGMIGITKDDFRTDNVTDYAACGVLDPLDDSVVEHQGRGKRVTIKGDNDVVLADLIIGKPFEGRDDFRLVRVPGQKRVYGAKIDLDISTKFSDWIEADLLEVDKDIIDRVVLRDYSIDERTGRVNQRDELTLEKTGEDWNANKLSNDQEVDRFKMNNLLRALDELTIVDVRPKPKGLSTTLQRTEAGVQISQSDMLSLQSKGYYFTRDGKLMSNEGELEARTTEGVSYTLRFGEIVPGSATDEGGGTASRGENRYLFITSSFDASLFPEPQKPANMDFQDKPDSLWTAEDHRMKGLQIAHDDWQRKVDLGSSTSDKLNTRFSDWYYVISAESFDKIHLTRADLVKEKPKS